MAGVNLTAIKGGGSSIVGSCTALPVTLLFYHTLYSNEMHVSRSKIPIKNLIRQRCAEGFNSGIKGLTNS
jgi:hypothetical protein